MAIVKDKWWEEDEETNEVDEETMLKDFMEFCKKNDGKLVSSVECVFDKPLKTREIELYKNKMNIYYKDRGRDTVRLYAQPSIVKYMDWIDKVYIVTFDNEYGFHSVEGDLSIRKIRLEINRSMESTEVNIE